VPLRRGSTTLGLLRLTDRLDGGEFGDPQRAAAEKFAGFAGQALDNAQRFRTLERRSFRDPVTKAYTRAYFDDVTNNELRKAARFGRTFSLLRIELAGLGDYRSRASEAEFSSFAEAACACVARALRATDLLAAESDTRFCVLLPETDALGAAVLKRRIRSGSSAPRPCAPSTPPHGPSSCSPRRRSRPTAPSPRRSGRCSRHALTRTAELVRSSELESILPRPRRRAPRRGPRGRSSASR
jgi:GGDEF domain-containing protein